MSAVFKEIDYLHRLSASGKTFVFLDSARLSSKGNHFSYLFIDPVEEVAAETHENVDNLLKSVDNYMKNNWVCGFLSYEAAYAMEKRFFSFQNSQKGGLPLGWFGVFDEPWIFNHLSGKWNRPLPDIKNGVLINEKVAEKLSIGHLVGKPEFTTKIKTIKNAIKNGETYQVNYTFDVNVQADSSPVSLYKHLRKKQKTPYCSFIQNRYGQIASFSPELFFRKEGRHIATKPMKGTAKRGVSALEDKNQVNFLKRDAKNCAENLMIVDLIRNDLGRICEAGTVNTEKLFEVETHPTLHQMTSEITGILKETISFSDIIKNLFPCGSVTGAPKIRTMEIIHDLEEGERGVYCGAIGYTSPKGNAVFNIPIRTLQKAKNDRDWRYRVGSGIVWDSTAEDEWKECAQKTSFLQHEIPDFEIIETMLFDKEFLYLREHISRMLQSAEYFQYPCTKSHLIKTMSDISGELDALKRYKIRLLLSADGTLSWENSIISDTAPKSTILVPSEEPVDETNTFLFHKTTHRPWYKQAMEEISKGWCYDKLFFNRKREITECAITNIFVEKGGVLYTPPVSCGLLPGTLRAHMLKSNKCREKVLYRKDLFTADKVYCGNSVRGLVEVKVKQKCPAAAK